MRTLLIALLGTLVSTPAFAAGQKKPGEHFADKAGSGGIGAGVTLGGVTGAQLRYFATTDFGIELTAGGTLVVGDALEAATGNLTLGQQLGNDTSDQGENFTTSPNASLGLGVHGEYKLVRGRKSFLSGIAGINITQFSYTTMDDVNETDMQEPVPSTSRSRVTNIVLDLGMRGEVFFVDRFSVYGLLGLSLDPIGDSDSTDISGMQIGFGGFPLGLAGFTVWFG